VVPDQKSGCLVELPVEGREDIKKGRGRGPSVSLKAAILNRAAKRITPKGRGEGERWFGSGMAQ